MDIVNEILNKNNELSACIKQLSEYGMQLAVKERDYKICLRQEALKLRSEKGMAVTLINQIIYGVPEVAEKRFQRDVAETMYQTCQERINTLKLQIRILESQIQREWNLKN
nr:hypothetical protein [bacterium]